VGRAQQTMVLSVLVQSGSGRWRCGVGLRAVGDGAVGVGAGVGVAVGLEQLEMMLLVSEMERLARELSAVLSLGE
jgi:hypothetical protein